MTRLTDLEIEQLKADKKLIVNYLKAVQRIHNLLETNKQQRRALTVFVGKSNITDKLPIT